MFHRAKYIFLLLFCVTHLFCQDTIVKRDSSKIIAKISEVNLTEIKYRQTNNLNGPTYVIGSYDIAYIIYKNGAKEVFLQTNLPHKSNIKESKKDSIVKTLKVNDYIKFNIQIGMVANNNYSNVQRKQPPPSHTSDEYYAPHHSNIYNYNINLGANFLFGRSPYVKHILGINYLHSRGEFEYSYNYFGNYMSRQEDLTYISHIDYLNFVNGIQFSIGKHLKLEPQISINAAVNYNEKINGTIKTTTVSGGYYPTVLNSEEVVYKDKKLTERRKISTISFTPKISYEFKIKQHTFGVYFSYNIAYLYRLPWYMAGITYYPCKKYSPQFTQKKLRLLKNIKVNLETAVTLNNSFMNTNENYSGIKPLNPTKQNIGYSIGANFHYGNDYVRHFFTTSLLKSNAELLRKTYTHDYNMDGTTEYVNTNTYKSKMYFINIGTGISFVIFKHFSFDNGILFNTPIYSHNDIQQDKTINQYDKQHNLITSSSNPTEKNSTDEFYLKKENWIFLARISYEFNINQNRFGVFCSWNNRFRNNGKWSAFGITYYPFKKLR